MNGQACRFDRSTRRLHILGGVAVTLLLSSFGVWAATSHLAGAVIAPGTVVVESSVKKVQHPTGGIVGQILVKEGDRVERGDVLVRLDDTVTRAVLNAQRVQLDELSAREARLAAERDDDREIVVPPALLARRDDPVVAAAIGGEKRLFAARAAVNAGQRAQLRERITQIEEEIRGLSAQLVAKDQEIALIAKELIGVVILFDKNLVSTQRLMQLKRDQARLDGERGRLVAVIAREKASIAETELQIIQLTESFRTDVIKELRETQSRLAEAHERIAAAQDQLRRIDIRAPQAGIVHELAVHTVGGVIAPGETLMEIVPQADNLVVQMNIPPREIDQVSVGSKARVRIMAGNQRIMSTRDAVISYVSADLSKDESSERTYYVARATLTRGEEATPALRLVPGMPAEVFVRTEERTPLQYLLAPLTEQIARTFRER